MAALLDLPRYEKIMFSTRSGTHFAPVFSYVSYPIVKHDVLQAIPLHDIVNFVLFLCAVLLLSILGWTINAYFSLRRESLALTGTSPIPFVRCYQPRFWTPFWLVGPYIYPLIQRLPFGWGDWVRYCYRDAQWKHKGTLPREGLGSDTYWILYPDGRVLITADADLIVEIAHRWRDFPKPIEYYKHLRLFGSSILTEEGSSWQYHRKLCAPSFSERNNSLVFAKAQDQAKAMLNYLVKTRSVSSQGISGQNIAISDMKTYSSKMALNVLSEAGFGHKMGWTDRSTKLSEAAQGNSFSEVLWVFVRDLITLTAVPWWLLRALPSASLRSIGKAPEAFSAHVENAIKAAVKGPGEKGASNDGSDLLSSMANAPASQTGKRLTREEIVANTFIFTLAGHETAANAMQTAFILLAMEPELQGEIQAEVDAAYASKADEGNLDYETDYSQLRRTMALMLETLRLYPPIGAPPKKSVGLYGQTATYRGMPLHIPTDTNILLDGINVQRAAQYWGPDAHVFRPSRWLQDESYRPPTNCVNVAPKHAHMLWPRRGAFLAFSEGVRDCVGKRFAEAEFVGVISAVMREWEVRLDGGGSMEGAKKRAAQALECRETLVTLAMQERVPLRFVRRQ